ncbi:MAG: Uma2 family endonuclease [Polyangiaceae bacterium]|jgi:Uma2 family endonuclease|nr:Uma2 family endonuclease [Polyangiaceae bacterium]
MAAFPASKRATYQDVLAAPRHMVAEVIDGQLHLHPRPAVPHAAAASGLGEELGPPFKRGRGGPGGWILLDEPELHLGTEPDILVPDLAGWRRERMPVMVRSAYVTLAPDWVCEVLSPSTRDVDRADKLPVYGREQVRHVWLVDPDVCTLEVLRLDGASYRIVGAWRGGAVVRAEPFDAIELDMAVLWADVEPKVAGT